MKAPQIRTAIALMTATLLCGCGGEHFQSVLHPASPEAGEISRLWWFMLAVCGTVFVIVIALLIVAIGRRGNRKPQAPGGDAKFVLIGGMLIPGIILFVLLIYSISAKVVLTGDERNLTIQVIGHQWWWEVRYPNQDIVIANEIYIPVGEPVRLQLKSADVIHSFWVPNLHGKMDMLPEHINTFWIRADKPGVYRGQCAEFCGAQHAWMAFEVVALSTNDFQQWVSERRKLAVEQVASAERKFSHEVYMRVGCGQCHAIKGTSAVAQIGPDLTHFGSRRTIGAGLMTNNTETLTRWILAPQKMKPGNLMPHTKLTDEELQELVAYLTSLK
ncbi:MAG: cytochrome c oxidase subunit II [Verrucomicrobia bacterium]|nr:cytochrome c oxidase subunit II [Verrucomicrobiota bacterium]